MEILSIGEKGMAGSPQAVPVCHMRALYSAMSEGFVTFFTSVCPGAHPSSEPMAWGVIFPTG